MASWQKAGYGGTTKKSGGGTVKSVQTQGDKGLIGGKGIPNSSFSRAKGIVTPTTEGNKGVIKGGGKSAKAPLD